ncbi:MAG: alpha/beta fold hydrolase [Candidatus Binatia bacterium]
MVILVHGYDGSGPGHWQRWLADELRRRRVPVAFPDLPEPAAPDKDRWVAALAEVVSGVPPPVAVVCHSLGCWAVDHLFTERGLGGVQAVLLVAPPSPYLLFDPVESFLPPPCRRAVWAPIAGRTLLVGSDNDDFTTPEELNGVANALGIRSAIVPGGGHINVDSGYGPWPFALEWLAKTGAFLSGGGRPTPSSGRRTID